METFYFLSGMLLTSVGVIISAFILGVLKVSSMSKQIKNLDESIQGIYLTIEHNTNENDKQLQNVYSTINNRTDVIHREIESRFNDNDHRIDGVHSYVDSRFDKWENKYLNNKPTQAKKELA
jgi:predicted PurR-regulated permease PerM